METYTNYLIVKCNNCEETFFEHELIYDKHKDKECCPKCGESGKIMDCFNLSDFVKNEVIFEWMIKGEFVSKILSPLCKYFNYTKCDYILAFDDEWDGMIGEYVRIFLNDSFVFSVNVTATSKRGILSSVIQALDCKGETQVCSYVKYKNFIILKEVV